MNKEFQKFKKNYRYLVKDNSVVSQELEEVQVLEATEVALKLQFNSAEPPYSQWFLKENFTYSVVQELPYEQQFAQQTLSKLHQEIKDLLVVQEESSTKDNYSLGLYNGLELCLALLEKRQPRYKRLPKDTTVPRYRVDVLRNDNKELTGISYELNESGNWLLYSDVKNLVDKHEHLLAELRRLHETSSS